MAPPVLALRTDVLSPPELQAVARIGVAGWFELGGSAVNPGEPGSVAGGWQLGGN